MHSQAASAVGSKDRESIEMIGAEDVLTRAAVWTVIQWLVAGLFVLLLILQYKSFVKDLYEFAITYLGLMLLIGALYALVFAQVATGLGIAYLFWHEDFRQRVSASWGATMLLSLIGVLVYYLDPFPLATDQKAAAWLVHDETLKRRVADFWRRWLGKSLPAPEQPVAESARPRWGDILIFALNTLVDPVSITPLQGWLDPRRENQIRLQRFLRTCRTPFLLLLLAPAVLPGVFSQIPRVAPTGGLELAKTPPIWDVSRFYEGGNYLKGYGLGVAAWLLGMILGVTLVRILIRVSELFLVTVKRARPLEPVEGQPGWIRADPSCPLFGDLPGCPGVGCPRASRLSGCRPPAGCAARRMLRISIVVLLLCFVASFAVLRVVEPLNRWVSPAFAICALLGINAMVYAFIIQFRPLVRPLVVAGLIVWLGIANNNPFKLQFERMKQEYAHPVDLRAQVDAVYFRADETKELKSRELVPDAVALSNWLRHVDPKTDRDVVDDRPKLVIVAVSGGAARSAFWTSVVLDRLERELPEFGRRVRIITGASGGMLGTSYYVSHRLDLAPSRAEVRAQVEQHRQGPFSPPDDWVQGVPHNSMRPLAKYIALNEIWQSLNPFVQAEDRGIALERDWRAIRFPFRLLAPLEKAGEIPSLVFAPMMIEDGRQLLISNLDLYRDENGHVLERPIVKTLGRDISYDDDSSHEQAISLAGLEFYRIFPNAKGLLLSTAVRMSASFAYASPAVNLPTQPPRRVVDAGYYDNYGIQVATAWVNQNERWLAEHTSGVLLVQIRDSSGVRDRLDIEDEPPGAWARALRGFQFFTSPIDAFSEARYSSAAFRNDTDVAHLDDQFAASLRGTLVDPGQFCTTVIFENSAEVTIEDEDVWKELRKLYDESFRPNASPVRHHEHEGAHEVAMTWYLTRAERLATRRAIPADPPKSSPLSDDKERQRLLSVLQGQVFATMLPDDKERLARHHGERILRTSGRLDWLPPAQREQAIRRAGLGELHRLGLLSFPPGSERDVRLKRLEQLRNYERVVNLKTWWTRAGRRK
jgi:hypothetical protein